MSKVPNDVRLRSDLAAVLDKQLEPYEGGVL
jgi:hypothetical protein